MNIHISSFSILFLFSDCCSHLAYYSGFSKLLCLLLFISLTRLLKTAPSSLVSFILFSDILLLKGRVLSYHLGDEVAVECFALSLYFCLLVVLHLMEDDLLTGGSLDLVLKGDGHTRDGAPLAGCRCAGQGVCYLMVTLLPGLLEGVVSVIHELLLLCYPRWLREL